MVVNKLLKDKYLWMIAIYVMASFFFGFMYGNGLILFLGWNLILAGVSAILSYVFVDLRQKKKHLILTLLVLGVFILFFPNTIYVMTDFIHLENYDFFREYADVYQYQIMDWVVLMMITWGALLSAKLGISSVDRIKPHLYQPIKPYTTILIFILFLLSSVGIYLGRFIRLNSWDIFNLFKVIPTIFEQFSFFMGFILIYTAIHLISYFILSESKHNSYN